MKNRKTRAKFNVEKARQWVEELESGKWKQENGFLCNNGEYCCLGVLAEVNGLEKFRDNSWSDYYDVYRFRYEGYDDDAILSDKFTKEFALTGSGERLSGGSVYVHGNQYSGLAAANDNHETFVNIAAALREIYGFEPREVE